MTRRFLAFVVKVILIILVFDKNCQNYQQYVNWHAWGTGICITSRTGLRLCKSLSEKIFLPNNKKFCFCCFVGALQIWGPLGRGPVGSPLNTALITAIRRVDGVYVVYCIFRYRKLSNIFLVLIHILFFYFIKHTLKV